MSNCAFVPGEESPDALELETMISQGYKIAVFPKPAFVVTGIKILIFRVHAF